MGPELGMGREEEEEEDMIIEGNGRGRKVKKGTHQPRLCAGIV